MGLLGQNKRKLDFLTVTSSGYADMSLALAISLKDNCERPFRLWVSCTDEESFQQIDALKHESLRPFLFPGIPDSGVAELSRKYAIPELCYASKGFAIKHLFNWGVSKLLYVDSDMCCFSDPTVIFERDLSDCSILLTPHFHVSESYKSKYGKFNVGFIGLRNDGYSNKFLDWWCGKCRDECRIDLSEGLYIDQKYVDEVPEKFGNVKIAEEPGYNAGHWFLEKSGYKINLEQKTVDSSRLIFNHFSGFRVTEDLRPYNLAGYYNHLISEQWPLYRKYMLYLLEARKLLGTATASGSDVRKPPRWRSFYWDIQRINPLSRINFLEIECGLKSLRRGILTITER